MLTDDELKVIESRAAKAPQGLMTYYEPWESWLITDSQGEECSFEFPGESSAEFFDRARADVPALVAEVRRLRSLLREIIDDASPCTTACNLMVEEKLIDRARELIEANGRSA